MNSLRIRSNTAAALAHKNLSKTQHGLQTTLERLSSGLRINKSSDDIAGSAISTRMSNQIRGMRQANHNAQQTNNLLQTAESGLRDISDILTRMRELSVQASTDTLNNTDRASLDLEYQSLLDEISRTAKSTNYNDLKVLDAESVKYDNFFTVFARSMSSVRESFCWSTLPSRLLRVLFRSAKPSSCFAIYPSPRSPVSSSIIGPSLQARKSSSFNRPHPVSTTLMMKALSTTNADTFFIWFLLKRKNINFLLVFY